VVVKAYRLTEAAEASEAIRVAEAVEASEDVEPVLMLLNPGGFSYGSRRFG